MFNLYAGIVPFVITLVLTPLVRRLAVKAGAYAKVNHRTIHHGRICRVGGIAIYIAVSVSMAFFLEIDQAMMGIYMASSLMFFTGLVDDFFNLQARYKLFMQIIAALIMIYYGIQTDAIHLPFGIVINNTFVSLVFSVVWFVGITNAINLSDGLDGLAGGISLMVFVLVFSISLVDHRYDIMALSMIMSGALLGFLIYNAHPASIFMGDCGSLFLGSVLASVSLLGFKSSTALTLALPILMMLLPIIDTISAFLRRKLKGMSFSEADKDHLHHQLMRRLGQGNAVIVMCGITFLFGISAFIYLYSRKLGILFMLLMLTGIEVFIEKTGMISRHYRPLLSLSALLITRLESFLEKARN